MIVTEHISTILLVTGSITALPLLQFLFPAKFLKWMNQIEISDEAGLFYARHLGLVVFSLGALLIFAAHHAEAREAIMLCALIEKLGIVLLIASNRKRPFTRGLVVTAIFDSVCSLLYLAYLAGWA